MKPKNSTKAVRKISPAMADRLVKHLGGKPLSRKTQFAKWPPAQQPQPHKVVNGRVDGAVKGK